MQYAENKQLKVFIIDPRGVEVIADTNKTKQGQIYQECLLESALNPILIGASRRCPLQDTFPVYR